MKELPETVGYCGLVCGVCFDLGPPGCDCRTAPKPQEADCYQRNCCLKRGLDGCWECGDFPCDKGYFGEKHGGWRALCVASVQYVRDHGLEALAELVVRRHGSRMDHSLYMHKTPEEALQILQGAGPAAANRGSAPRGGDDP
ncbi:unnamed protein product [marine sediment metagenome]|uniref:DUF3795 domain-containing protein n=1 Tax=marine sediment metagenome TaxID=412755 RepID=X0VEI2_9ZZZZ